MRRDPRAICDVGSQNGPAVAGTAVPIDLHCTVRLTVVECCVALVVPVTVAV